MADQIVLDRGLGHLKTKTLFQRIKNFFTDDGLPKEWSQRFLYSSKEADELTGYERRIVELANGRSIKDMVETLYHKAVMHGGWAACIGMVERQWKYEMAQTVEELVKRGYIYCDSRERETTQAIEPQGLAEEIGLHLRVYQRLHCAERLSNNGLTKNTLPDIIHQLTDVRQVLAGSNGVFGKKERRDIERNLTMIYDDAVQKVLYN